MIELFTQKQVHCDYCGFEFSFTGFGSVAQIVCPACGEEIALDTTKAPPQFSEEERSEMMVGAPAPVPSLCSVGHCPLLTGDESGKAVAEELKIRFHQGRKRRRTILTWTVTIQVSVLLGVALFVAQTWWMDEGETTISPVSVSTEPIPEPTSAEISTPNIVPPPAEEEFRTAWYPTSLPSDPYIESDYPLSPYETVPEISVPVHTGGLTPPALAQTSPAPAQTSPAPALTPHTHELANELLESAKNALATDPESSVEQAVQAAKIYEQLGQPYPETMYWILGNAFASLAWGEPLLEAAPAIETMTLSPDSRYLLAQLRDHTVWLWDLQEQSTERKGFCLYSGTDVYVKFVFDPELRWIIGGQKDGTIRIWDMSLAHPAEKIITFAERIHDLQDLQLSPDGRWLAAYGYSVKSVPVAGHQPPQRPIQLVNYQQERAGMHDAPYPVLLWNLRQMEVGVVPRGTLVPAPAGGQKGFDAPPAPAHVIRFSPHSDRLAVGRRDATVSVYDLTAKGVAHDPLILRGHQLGITQIAFAPNGEWLATGSQDNTVRLWNLANSRTNPESATLYGHAGWISSLAIDASGEYVVSGSYDRTIRIWNVQQNRIASARTTEPIVLTTGLGVPETLHITQDGDKLIALGNGGSLGIYHLPSLLNGDPEEPIGSVTFRNSKLLISRSLLTADEQVLIFSYEHLSNPSNSGIRLWPLRSQPFIQ